MIDNIDQDIPDIYRTMIRQCYHPQEPGYDRIGGRGVGVFGGWKKSMAQFQDDMGPRPAGGQLCRHDVSAGFSPKNCYWSS